MAQLLYSSIFGELTKHIQLRFDAISELRKKLYDNVIFENYLDWDDPTIETSFEELIGQYNITIAAPTIGYDSKEAILPENGAETLKEKVLRHAITRPMTIQTYRKILAILDSKAIDDKTKTQRLVNIMWGEVKDVVASVMAKLDMIFLRSLSNEGIFELDAQNNPEGGVKATLNFNQPGTNIAQSTVAWTQSNMDVVDPFDDIQGIIDAASDKAVFKEILCAPALISYMMRSKKMKQVMFGTDKSASPVTLAALNQFMTANELPSFKPIRRIVNVQNPDGSTTAYTPWNVQNMVFIPETENGKIGIVKNAYANNELRVEPGVAYSNYGRIRVSQWGVGETQNSNGVEFAKAEVMALPVVTEFDGIFTLKTQFA